MKTLSGVLIISILFISAISCEKENKNDISDQKIYFEYYSINLAWGLLYKHWIIDNQGNVRENKVRDSIIWINPENLNDYVDMFDTVIYKVDKTELDYYAGLISKAATGEIDTIDQYRPDYGGHGYNCFYRKDNKYIKVILSMMSANEDLKNIDTNAIKIDTWLKNLQSDIFPR